MLRNRIFAYALALSLALAPYARGGQGATKGYEMYSWKQDGGWSFALVPGTNRVKDFQEIVSGPFVRRGMSAIKEELRKLPKGTEVVWGTAANPSIDRGSLKDSPRLEHPSGKRVRKLKRFCDELGLKLQLA